MISKKQRKSSRYYNAVLKPARKYREQGSNGGQIRRLGQKMPFIGDPRATRLSANPNKFQSPEVQSQKKGLLEKIKGWFT